MNLRDPNLPFNLTTFRALQDELRRMDAARLEPQQAALAQALRNVLTVLKTINEDPEGAINDTLWYSDHETLFDYIENTLTAAPLAARQDELRWMDAVQAPAVGDSNELATIKLREWAIARWRDEVENRPLVNKYRRSLDDTWRQVIRFAGGDPDEILGPPHDALLAASQPPVQESGS